MTQDNNNIKVFFLESHDINLVDNHDNNSKLTSMQTSSDILKSFIVDFTKINSDNIKKLRQIHHRINELRIKCDNSDESTNLLSLLKDEIDANKRERFDIMETIDNEILNNNLLKSFDFTCIEYFNPTVNINDDIIMSWSDVSFESNDKSAIPPFCNTSLHNVYLHFYNAVSDLSKGKGRDVLNIHFNDRSVEIPFEYSEFDIVMACIIPKYQNNNDSLIMTDIMVFLYHVII